MECAHELIKEMTLNKMNMGAALGGILTQTLTALMHLAPDNETAMQVVSSCLHNASTTVETNNQTHDTSDKIH